ncbi:alanine--tRNA ligase [Patescibacteria group bacterium]|nr:alanine--tRNA ligase [Patescibacteria group bacterium]
MTLFDIRKKYLEFFENKGHKIVPSSSLIPENDPTTLFTGSGMQPMVPYLLGESHPEGKRVADSQKCFRTGDIDEVGDCSHTTFFEMLGNWSFGDYFKKEQLEWIFEFLTDENTGIGLKKENIYVTVFRGNDTLGIPRDDTSIEIWKSFFSRAGLSSGVCDMKGKEGKETVLGGENRIFLYGEEKNWWSRVGVPQNMPVGEPGGPDSEIFYDFGEKYAHHSTDITVDHVNSDSGRFLEIGNNVFMEYKKTDGEFDPLPQKNVDFGGGLERVAAAKNENPDVFMIDVFLPVIEKLEELSGKKYGDTQKHFRIIMDHLRAALFLISDGAFPSNKDQGYFTRRLIRRAVRSAREVLGIESDICRNIIESYIDVYKNEYPGLGEKKDAILDEAEKEEKKFEKTLERGLKEFNKLDAVDGKTAFMLFSTYGFPLELTEELAIERGFAVDKKAFENEFKKHQELSRKGGEKKFKGGLADDSETSKKYHTATHLLHQALRKVLGDHVEQRGSNITAKRLRFDFTHPDKLTDEEKKQVEALVNIKIAEEVLIACDEKSLQEAKEEGAIGLFVDRYGDRVKVYSIGDFSKEICGGPHVDNTKELGHFKIKKEESSSAGVRRIKAILE